MMQKADNIVFRRVMPDMDSQVFDALSALDKACIGADGWSAESFRTEIEKDTGIVIMCYTDMEIVGLISGYFAADEADITGVAVNKNYRRQKIALHLMAEFEKNLPECTNEIFLEVRESNFPAISLYEKCGFEKLSVRKNFYENPTENAMIMRKIVKKEEI